MQIREGAYYRTRGGQVFGPMVPGGTPASDYVWCLDPLIQGYNWDSEGSWRKGWDGPLDLISEVYVSDTPPAVKETEDQLREMMRDPRYWRTRDPEYVKRVTEGFRALVGGDTPPDVKETEADWRTKLIDAGPNGPLIETHDRKTLRDEFAMEAMKLLIPRHERKEETLAEFAYRQADAMMEARNK